MFPCQLKPSVPKRPPLTWRQPRDAHSSATALTAPWSPLLPRSLSPSGARSGRPGSHEEHWCILSLDLVLGERGWGQGSAPVASLLFPRDLASSFVLNVVESIHPQRGNSGSSLGRLLFIEAPGVCPLEGPESGQSSRQPGSPWSGTRLSCWSPWLWHGFAPPAPSSVCTNPALSSSGQAGQKARAGWPTPGSHTSSRPACAGADS